MNKKSWRKSSYTGAENNCVMVAFTTGMGHVADSKDPNGGELTLPFEAFGAWVARVKAGEFDPA